MVARQLKVLSQVDAFTISATRNIEHAFKKLVCLTVFVKDLFYIYLNNIYHTVFSLYLVCRFLGERSLYALPSNKRSQNSTYFQIQAACVAMETESCILNKEFNESAGLFVNAVLLKHNKANILRFLLKLCQYECGWGKL